MHAQAQARKLGVEYTEAQNMTLPLPAFIFCSDLHFC